MPRDEAAAIGWPPVRLVPDPTPERRAASLRVLILDATDAYGADIYVVQKLKTKFDAAMKDVVRLHRRGK